MSDLSPDFQYNRSDARILRRILPHAKTPMAIKVFARFAERLSDYAYWFTLGTLWVDYTGFSDLDLWKELFSSERPQRASSLMKPSELKTWQRLPDVLTLYRAHRPGESDWIAYTLSPENAAIFAHRRGVASVHQYRVAKMDCLCLFLRRGEQEVLVLDKSKPVLIREMPVVVGR